MKIIFIDETSKEKESKCFLCLCGIVVDASYVTKLEHDLEKFKKKYKFNNLKDFRKPDKIETKLQKSEELFNILKKYEVNIISAVILKDSLKKIKICSRDNFESDQRIAVLNFILERFYFHVNRRNQSGLVIFDSLDNKIENRIQKMFFKRVSKNFKKIFPSLLFSKDEYSNIIQVSDLIAASLNSALYNSLKEEKMIEVSNLFNFNSYLKIYWNLFERNNKNNSVEGWGIKLWY